MICAYHNNKAARSPGSVIKCTLEHELHSDLNGALNILKKATGKLIKRATKPLSYLVFYSRLSFVKGE